MSIIFKDVCQSIHLVINESPETIDNKLIQKLNSGTSSEILSNLMAICLSPEKFHERHAIDYLDQAQTLGLLPRKTAELQALLSHFIRRHKWKTSLFATEQNRCFPSMKGVAKVLGCSEDKARRCIKTLEEACILRRVERRSQKGGQLENLYRITPVFYWEYCIYSVTHTDPYPQNLGDILQYLHKQREAAIAEEQEYHRDNPTLAKIVGLRGAAISRIKAIKELIAQGHSHDSQQRPLLERLAHWQEVFSIHQNKELELRQACLDFNQSKHKSCPSGSEGPPPPADCPPPPLQSRGSPPGQPDGQTQHITQQRTPHITPPVPSRESRVINPIAEEEEKFSSFFNLVKENLKLKFTETAKREFISVALQQGFEPQELKKIAKTFAQSPYLRMTTKSLNRLLHLDIALNSTGKNGNRIGDNLMRQRVLEIVRLGANPMDNPTVKSWKCSQDELYRWLGLPIPSQHLTSSEQLAGTDRGRADTQHLGEEYHSHESTRDDLRFAIQASVSRSLPAEENSIIEASEKSQKTAGSYDLNYAEEKPSTCKEENIEAEISKVLSRAVPSASSEDYGDEKHLQDQSVKQRSYSSVNIDEKSERKNPEQSTSFSSAEGKSLVKSCLLSGPAKVNSEPTTRLEYIDAISLMLRKRDLPFRLKFYREVYPKLETIEQTRAKYHELKEMLAKVA